MTGPDVPRRIELPPGTPLWDGVHDTSVEGTSTRCRGRCTCGWHGRWRRNLDRAGDAQADADEHYNNET